MKKTACGLLAAAVLSAALCSGCIETATPQRETNETRADRGVQSYGGFQAPASDRHMVIDTRNAQRGTTTRSAHAIAYELEYQKFVRGASVLVVGPDAFVGIKPPPGATVTPEQIGFLRGKVQGMDPTLRRVYVTTEPQTVQYLSDYTKALEQGLPLARYEQLFKPMIEQTWPTGP